MRGMPELRQAKANRLVRPGGRAMLEVPRSRQSAGGASGRSERAWVSTSCRSTTCDRRSRARGSRSMRARSRIGREGETGEQGHQREGVRHGQGPASSRCRQRVPARGPGLLLRGALPQAHGGVLPPRRGRGALHHGEELRQQQLVGVERDLPPVLRRGGGMGREEHGWGRLPGGVRRDRGGRGRDRPAHLHLAGRPQGEAGAGGAASQ